MKQKGDCVEVVWKDPRSRENFVIGEIIRSNGYTFRYTKEAKKAQAKGFPLLLPFEDIDKEYMSNDLFQIFASRLPDRKRRDIGDILKKYDLDEYDEFELLKQGAELPIDTLKFVEPITIIDHGFQKVFFVEGIRHYLDCKGDTCDSINVLGEPLGLLPDFKNKYDKYAVKVVNSKNDTIGYVPRYYSEAIAKSLSKGDSFKISVEEFRKDHDCSTCLKIKIRLTLEKSED